MKKQLAAETNAVYLKRFNGSTLDLTPTLEIDGPKRKKGTLQIANTELNGEEIRGFLLGHSVRSLERVVLFPSVERLSKLKLLGVQDGVNKKFNLPWDCVKDFKLYKNGNLVPQSDYAFIFVVFIISNIELSNRSNFLYLLYAV